MFSKFLFSICSKRNCLRSWKQIKLTIVVFQIHTYTFWIYGVAFILIFQDRTTELELVNMFWNKYIGRTTRFLALPTPILDRPISILYTVYKTVYYSKQILFSQFQTYYVKMNLSMKYEFNLANCLQFNKFRNFDDRANYVLSFCRWIFDEKLQNLASKLLERTTRPFDKLF